MNNFSVFLDAAIGIRATVKVKVVYLQFGLWASQQNVVNQKWTIVCKAKKEQQSNYHRLFSFVSLRVTKSKVDKINLSIWMSCFFTCLFKSRIHSIILMANIHSPWSIGYASQIGFSRQFYQFFNGLVHMNDTANKR